MVGLARSAPFRPNDLSCLFHYATADGDHPAFVFTGRCPVLIYIRPSADCFV